MPRASLVAAYVTVALVGLTPALVRAAPGSGTTADPVRIDALAWAGLMLLGVARRQAGSGCSSTGP